MIHILEVKIYKYGQKSYFKKLNVGYELKMSAAVIRNYVNEFLTEALPQNY